MIEHTSMRVNICSVLAFGFLTIAAFDPVLAQRGRGGPGGRGFDRTSPFGMLSRDEIRDELKLTDEQVDRIKKLEEEAQEAASQQTPAQFPQNDEDRAAWFAQFRKEQEARNTASMEKIKGVLEDNQYQRLEQLRLQTVGLGALGTEPVATELKLSDKQQEDLSKLLQEYQAARMNFRAPREEREKTTEDLSAKIMAVLSSEQKKAWESKLGPPLPEGDGDGRGPSTTANSSVTTNATSTAPRPSYTPPENDGPVVVSLDGTQEGGPTARAGNEKPPAAKSNAAPTKERTIRFHLENAPWEMVLHEFARKAGLTLQILDLPPGSLTYTNDDAWYTPTEALDILHGYLLQKGFVMVKRDRFLVVLSVDAPGGIPPNLIPNIPLSDLEIEGKYGKHELVNVVLPLEGAEANDAAREVEALKGPQGRVVPLSVSNSLVVTDSYANVKRIHNLLKGVTTIDPEAQQFKSFPLKYIIAEEAAIIVRDQLGLPLSGSSTSSSDRGRFPFGFQFPGSSSSRSSSSSSRSTSSSSAQASTAKVTPDPRTNSLLVTATKNEVAIAEQILTTIDIQADDAIDGRPTLRVYHLKKADVDEVRKTLDKIMPGLVVGDDEERNGGRIHVKATPRQHEQIAELIAKMDGSASQSVEVIPLSSFDPVGVASTLNSMFASDGESAPMIMADTSGRRLMVRGSSEQISEIKLFLDKLGAVGGQQNLDRGPLRTYPLGGRDPEEFARILEQVWSNNSTTPVRVVIPSNNLIRERKIPSLMDLDDLPLRDPSLQTRPSSTKFDPKSTMAPAKPLFPVSVEEENAEPAPARAETPVEDSPEHAAPKTSILRISKTGEMTLNGDVLSPTQLSIQLGQWKEANPDADLKLELSIHPATPAVRFAPVLANLDRSGVQYTMKMSADEEPETETQEAPADSARSAPRKNQPTVATANGKLPVTVTVVGGDLRLIGESDTLDEMEGMIEQLALAIPPRTTWTVYYLRSADVTETAVMLEQLFPSSSVSADTYNDGSIFGGLTSSLSSLGGGLADAAGLNSLTQGPTTLRIIPELRSNSLFVSGPADQVRQVEQMLRVLDADDLPETLRDRVPRMIPVEYANVAEVYNIVKDVYRVELEDPRQAQSRNNPLAMMMGGGSSNSRSSRGGNSNNGPSGVKMTIGVDTQNSKLIVAASDSLFQQVKETVAELDKGAFEAKRSVQVVSVNEASAAVLQQALTTLLPNVSVSTTSSSSSDRGGSENNRSSFGGSSDDAERRARFEEYFRSRSSGGDSSRSTGSPFGGYSRGGDSGRTSFGGYSRGGDSGRSSFGGSSRGGDSGRSSFGGYSRGGDSGRSSFGGFRGGDSGRGR